MEVGLAGLLEQVLPCDSLIWHSRVPLLPKLALSFAPLLLWVRLSSRLEGLFECGAIQVQVTAGVQKAH